MGGVYRADDSSSVKPSLSRLGPRHVIAIALQTVRRALGIAIQIVGIVVLLKIIVRRTWLVLLLSAVVVLPIAMKGTFAGEELALELTISTLGIALRSCCAFRPRHPRLIRLSETT
jgi:hypothetical protein